MRLKEFLGTEFWFDETEISKNEVDKMEFSRVTFIKYFLFLIHKSKDNLVNLKSFYEVVSLKKYGGKQ